MNLYQFFNPLAIGADKLVIIEASSNKEALNAYLARYAPNCSEISLYNKSYRVDAITVKAGIKQLDDGVILFSTIFKFIIK